MAPILLSALLAAALFLAPAETGPRLIPRPPVARGVDAFPRLDLSAGPSAARINAALDRADARVRAAAKDCTASGGRERSDWSRRVTVPFRGPAFVSLVAADDYFCGGAYPDTATAALTYDLATGAPVNWARLFPKAVAGDAATETVSDGTVVGTLASPALSALYRTKVVAQADPSLRQDCAGLFDAPVPVMLWLDAAIPAVRMQTPSFPHAVKVCADAVSLTLADLKRLGAAPRLTEALVAAHAAWTPAQAPR